MNRLVLIGALLAATLVGLWAFANDGAAGSGGSEWAQVRREDLVVGAEVTGTLQAVQSTLLGPPQLADVWDFKIAFMAPEGKTVRAGEPVLGFDTSELESRLLERAASRDSAEKELEKRITDLEIRRGEEQMLLAEAQAKLRRSALKAGVPPELVAANELRETRTDVNLAQREILFRQDRLRLFDEQGRAELEALRKKRDIAAARVRETQTAIQRMTVTAPREGTVVYVTDRGEKKKIGDSCWRGERVIEIPDLRRMRAEGQIDEADAGRVARGQRVTLKLDAHPDILFAGRVQAIRDSVQRKSRGNPLKVVEVTIDLDRTDPQRMSPGMRFVGNVEVERVARALVIPAEAVFSRPDGPAVYRESGDEARPRLGRRNGRFVEILSGLREGDRVALRDPEAPEVSETREGS